MENKNSLFLSFLLQQKNVKEQISSHFQKHKTFFSVQFIMKLEKTEGECELQWQSDASKPSFYDGFEETLLDE